MTIEETRAALLVAEQDYAGYCAESRRIQAELKLAPPLVERRRLELALAHAEAGRQGQSEVAARCALALALADEDGEDDLATLDGERHFVAEFLRLEIAEEIGDLEEGTVALRAARYSEGWALAERDAAGRWRPAEGHSVGWLRAACVSRAIDLVFECDR